MIKKGAFKTTNPHLGCLHQLIHLTTTKLKFHKWAVKAGFLYSQKSITTDR